MTEESQALAERSGLHVRIRWRSVRARLLARRGQFAEAKDLVEKAEALASPTSWNVEKAGVLMAKAEVYWLAGQPDRAEASLRAAWRIYEDLHVVPLAVLSGAALAGLADNPGVGHT
jgi:tetratricopeptide (TPR) repeat protein